MHRERRISVTEVQRFRGKESSIARRALAGRYNAVVSFSRGIVCSWGSGVAVVLGV